MGRGGGSSAEGAAQCWTSNPRPYTCLAYALGPWAISPFSISAFLIVLCKEGLCVTFIPDMAEELSSERFSLFLQLLAESDHSVILGRPGQVVQSAVWVMGCCWAQQNLQPPGLLTVVLGEVMQHWWQTSGARSYSAHTPVPLALAWLLLSLMMQIQM